MHPVECVWPLAVAFTGSFLVVTATLYALRRHHLRALPLCDVVEPLGLRRALPAFAAEWMALTSTVLTIPLGWCMRRTWVGTGTHGPLVLVHGYGLNAGSLWWLRRRLQRDGWGPIYCCRYRSLRTTLDRAAEALRQELRAAPPRGAPLTLIGHGAGGLVIRHYLRRTPAPTVRRVITLGTPHRGTVLARYGPWRHSLAPGAPSLVKLNAVDRLPQQFDVIAIYSTFDAVALPHTHARYPGAFNIQLDNVGHHALLYSHKVYRLIAENLAAPFR